MNVADLVELARKKSNTENSDFVTDTEILGYLQNSWNVLYDELVNSDEDYAISSVVIPIVSGTQSYDLPEDFYKIKAIDWPIDSTRFFSLRKYNFQERNKHTEDLGYPKYSLMNNTLRLNPIPSQSANVILYYIPLPETIDGETNLVGVFRTFNNFLVIDTAIQIMIKELGESSILEGERNREMNRIRQSCSNRDTGAPLTIVNFLDV